MFETRITLRKGFDSASTATKKLCLSKDCSAWSAALGRAQQFPVAISKRPYPIPSRTRKSSSSEPMVLQGQPCGRVGRCRVNYPKKPFGNPKRLFAFCLSVGHRARSLARWCERGFVSGSCSRSRETDGTRSNGRVAGEGATRHPHGATNSQDDGARWGNSTTEAQWCHESPEESRASQARGRFRTV